MKDGFIKVAAAHYELRVADCAWNARQAIETAQAAAQLGVRVLVLPELCLTGGSCGDLFFQEVLLQEALKALDALRAAAEALDLLVFAGLPVREEGCLYNCTAALYGGRLLGLIPARNAPVRDAWSQGRCFTPGPAESRTLELPGQTVPFGRDLTFRAPAVDGLTLGCITEADLTAEGLPRAALLVCPAVGEASIGACEDRELLARALSRRLCCGLILSGAGRGESSTDCTFAGHALIVELGVVLGRGQSPEPTLTGSDLDLERIAAQRVRSGMAGASSGHVSFPMPCTDTRLTVRPVDPAPFLPEGTDQNARCRDIFQIQVEGLRQRLGRIGAKAAVVGLSGGLDSTLALLVTAAAFDALGLPRSGIQALTLPCFGTTSRTKSNAWTLAQRLNVPIREIAIGGTVLSHFRDIGLPEDDRSVTFENAQARERTQVLFDMANRLGGLVVGTGDLSELALGWATFNGDHMSGYDVNGGLPKTLVRAVVGWYAGQTGDETLRATLLDVLATPVSPELLPPDEGEIAQKTEELVGPYELHDFFLYYILRWGFAPRKVLRLARAAFAGQYDDQVLLYWLKSFYSRFFAMQFKRSCLTDGPAIGSVSLSPRGAWQMPSDASARAWLSQLEMLEEK